MNCPTGCATPLVMSERQGVEIDYCPTCRGVWLDRGELDKIIDRAGYDSSDSPSPVGSASHERAGERPRKKKMRSFLEEMFEMGQEATMPAIRRKSSNIRRVFHA